METEPKPGWKTTEGAGTAAFLGAVGIVIADPTAYGEVAVSSALMAGAIVIGCYALSRSRAKGGML